MNFIQPHRDRTVSPIRSYSKSGPATREEKSDKGKGAAEPSHAPWPESVTGAAEQLSNENEVDMVLRKKNLHFVKSRFNLNAVVIWKIMSKNTPIELKNFMIMEDIDDQRQVLEAMPG
ncbi:hypothetical protein OROMI_008679 [Orobanche minor]